ncbi:MAG TPA: hypothetical protein VK141_00925 [Nitrosomonas sp.]|nr:hypothetical protein [Nitrosomonas sp.]
MNDGGGIYALDTGVQQRHPLKWCDGQVNGHAKYGNTEPMK